MDNLVYAGQEEARQNSLIYIALSTSRHIVLESFTSADSGLMYTTDAGSFRPRTSFDIRSGE